MLIFTLCFWMVLRSLPDRSVVGTNNRSATTAMRIGTSRARLFLRFLTFLRKLSFLTRLRRVSRSILGELICLPASIRLRFYFALARRGVGVAAGAGAALFGASFHTSLNCNLNQ